MLWNPVILILIEKDAIKKAAMKSCFFYDLLF
ncbi:hypothetical protein SAMN05421743_10319 [Thalassobacillus cyri]|uniref:Uncharacterized protein n=1 Tax=Thalassobacillus cyri TaxID=571932 RepID=A0A1H3YT37_9BACI|nr:hypothetical protein SAMN05421743_10319 [Thalassobacillus cyri]